MRLLREEERLQYDQLLDAQHDLRSGQLVGEQLRYVAEHNGTWLALLSWCAGSYHLKDRDQWIGTKNQSWGQGCFSFTIQRDTDNVRVLFCLIGLLSRTC